ncbi:YybH family protein [Chthonobacter rhizosphaerae]|uniref:YybH family protein n=1 Tax=Chthonobacter rhizosphaerae TaxID=2735553 RepID=UPI0015EE5901|nr:SgcJ/EcaC family oxidoreductase [Chthonobacter rhizosphaerae]
MMYAIRSTVYAATLVCAISAAKADSVRTAIDTGNAEFVAAYNRGDAAGIAARYTEDAQLLPPGESAISGRTAVEAYWKTLIDAGLKNLSLKALEVGSDGDMAYEVGEYAITVPKQGGEESTDSGKYLIVYKMVGEKWLLHRDMWNGNPTASR